MTSKIISAILLSGLAISPLAAKGVIPVVDVLNFRFEQEPGNIKVDFNLHIGDKAVKSRQNLTLLPILTNGNDSLALRPVRISGKRARIMQERRYIASPKTMRDFSWGDAITAEAGDTVNYSAEIVFRVWMPGAELLLDGILEDGHKAVRYRIGSIADDLIVPEQDFYRIERTVIKGKPLTTGTKMARVLPYVKPASEQNDTLNNRSAYMKVYFRLNRSEVDPNYRDNLAVLTEFLSAIREIESSQDGRIVKVVIGGFASPDGGGEPNRRLAAKRADAIRKLILENTKLAPQAVETFGGGEDWSGLRRLVATSEMEGKAEILEILDKDCGGDPDIAQRSRESELKKLKGGAPYRFIYKNFFPELRSAAYMTIYYEEVM